MRQIEAYQCRKCTPTVALDSHCQTGPAFVDKGNFIGEFFGFKKSSPNSLTLASGFPIANSNPADVSRQFRIGHSRDGICSLATGELFFADGKRPTAVGDEIDAVFKANWSGNTYQARVRGKVYIRPTPVTPPACQNAHYLAPIYD